MDANFQIKITRFVCELKVISAALLIRCATLECFQLPAQAADLLLPLELQLELWYAIRLFHRVLGSNYMNSFEKVGSTSCVTDWLTIPCSSDNGRAIQTGNTICQDRLCGDAFNSIATQVSGTVISQSRPFRVSVHFDGFEANVPTSLTSIGGVSVAAQFNNRGFCLSYIQQPCTA